MITMDMAMSQWAVHLHLKWDRLYRKPTTDSVSSPNAHPVLCARMLGEHRKSMSNTALTET